MLIPQRKLVNTFHIVTKPFAAKKMTLKNILLLSIMTVFTLPSAVFTLSEDKSNFEIELAHEVVRLVETCFTNTNRLIALSGDVSEMVSKKIHESESTAVTIMSLDVPSSDKVYTIAKQSMQIYHSGCYYRFEHKAQAFLLSAKSQPILHQQVRDLKNSRWWNAGGLFIIVNAADDHNEGCENAETFLWLAWHYGMLSSVFICHDANGRLTVYSYCPYNDMSSKNWIKAGQRPGRSGHPWILVKRYVSESPEDCSETFYEKTRTLSGYKIRTNAVSLPPRLSVEYDRTAGIQRYTGEEGELMRCIFNFLNASVQDVTYEGKDHIGFFDVNGTYSGMLGDVFTGRVDLGLNGRYMVHMWQLAMSESYASTDICFVVKSRGNVPQWTNLATVFDAWVNLGVVIMVILSTAVLSYHGGVSAGCMNVLRLVISVAMIRPPSEFPARLFMSSVFLLLLIVTGLFQGRLVSLLTKPRAFDNPDTISDLVNDGYKVVGYTPFLVLIDNPVLRSRYESDESIDYIDRLLTDDKIAGVFDCRIISYKSKNYTKELHFVREKLKTFYLVFTAVLDWPLLERFNQVIRRLFETGFPGFWQARNVLVANTHRGTESFQRNNSPTLSLQGLAFIFNWLLFGLTFATLVFFLEVIFIRYRMKFRK